MANPVIDLRRVSFYDLKVYRNDTTGMIITFLDDDAAPIDKSGSQFDMTVRDTEDAVTTIVLLSSAGGSPKITIGGTGNSVVTIKGLDAIPWSATPPVYDFQEIPSVGERLTHLKGNVIVEKDVTHA